MIFASKQVQRINNFALAALLVISTITASVPFIFSQSASAVSGYAYKGIPSVQPVAYPSLGYAATSTTEFGDRIQLGGDSTARHLDNVTFSMTSWACETGAWNTNDCVSTPGATFSHPVTVNLYNTVPASDAVGSLIATKTETVTAKYRPSTDPTCTGGKWSDGANCYNGIAFDTTFDFSGLDAVLPNEVIATVAYSTAGSGPFDSLNFSLAETAPTVGVDVSTNEMYWDTTYPGYTAGLAIDGGWSPYHLAMDISTSPIVVPTPTNVRLTKDSDGSTIPSGSTVNYSDVTMKWNTVPDAERYQIRVTDPAGATQANRYTGYFTFDLNDATRHGFFGTQQGEWKYEVRTKDATFGLWSAWSTPQSLTFDSQKPTAVLTSPTTSVFTNGTSLVIHAEDNLALKKVVANVYKTGVAGVFKPTQATAGSALMFDHSVSLSTFADGDYYVKFNATDNAGNVSSTTTFNFTVDNTAPVAPVLTGAPVRYMQPGTVVRTWDKSTSTDVTSYVYKSFNSAADAQNPDTAAGWSPAPFAAGQESYSISGPTGTNNRTFWYRVAAIDAAGNKTWSNETYKVVADKDAPVVAIADVTVADKSLAFTVSGTDNLSGANTVGVNIYNEDNTGDAVIAIGRLANNITPETLAVGPYEVSGIDLSTLESGIYTIRAAIRDHSGNIAYTTTQFTIDNTAPTVTIDPLTVGGSTPTITGTIGLDDLDAAIVVTIDGIDYDATIAADGTWSYTVTTPLADGNYTVSVVATDTAGNTTDAVEAELAVVTVVPPTTDTTTGPATVTTVTPTVTSPAANAAVLGANTDNTDAAAANGEAGVEGATDDKLADAVNSEANQGTIFGIAWYWWILILAALAALGWFIAGAIRRRNEDQA